MSGNTNPDLPPSRSRTDGMTLEEVAAELGLSKQRISQIERSALLKLRRWLIATLGPDALELLSAVPDDADQITANDSRVIHYQPGAEP